MTTKAKQKIALRGFTLSDDPDDRFEVGDKVDVSKLTDKQRKALVDAGAIAGRDNDLSDLTRAALDEFAGELGVKDPAKLDKKDDVVKAIREQLDGLEREQLDTIATNRGIADVGDLPNKVAVIDAIERSEV